jgi:carbon monoxide dehydrogenase subunit G
VLRAELTIEIARSADDVFGYLTDVDKLPEWQGSVVSSHADGPLKVGSRIVEQRALLGHEAETELEVTSYEPARFFARRTIRGPVDLTIDHELEEAKGETRLHVTATGKPGGLLRFAARAVEAKARHELRRDFERLKANLERARTGPT